MSIGKRPTFYNDGNLTTEVFIFDFNRDIYGKNVTVKVIERIRGEEKFSSADELVKQMNKDVETGIKILAKKVTVIKLINPGLILGLHCTTQYKG